MNIFRLSLLALASLTIVGCSTSSNYKNNTVISQKQSKQNEIVIVGMDMLNIKYNWGGKRPDFGLDCSGLVTQVYQRAIDYKITGAARHMAKQGKKVSKSHAFNKKLEIGDLLFFNTTGKSYSHVGIYIGDDKFLHASSGKGKVITSSVHNPYYKKRLELIKRIL